MKANALAANAPARKHELVQVSQADWDLAETRLAAMERLTSAVRLSRGQVEDEARFLGVSRARVYDWLRRYRMNPSIETLLPRRRGPEKGRGRLPEATEVVINDAIREFYLRPEKPKLTALVVEIARRCRQQGIADVPDRRAVKARVDRLPPSTLVRAREGLKAAKDAFRPVRGALVAEYPLQIVQFDHTLADVIVVDELHRQPLQRPWLTLGVDVASRAVTGFYLSLEAPSSLSIAMALTHSVLPKETWLAARGIGAPWPVSGLPEHIHLDNAREFHGMALERGCREHGIELQFRPPATPHFGGHIERLIGTMMGAVHLLPGTTFSSIAEKGDYDAEAASMMTLRELEHWLAIQVIAYNGTVHSQTLLPPAVVWPEEIDRRPKPVRQPKDSARFLLDFLPFEMRMVRRDGLRLFNIHYWDDVLSPWAGQSKERRMVRYDPRDLSKVFLHGPGGRFHAIPCRDLRRPKITLWEHQRARDELRRRGIAAMDEQMLFDAVTAQREIVAEASARTKAARRVAQRTAYALEATQAAGSLDRSGHGETHLGQGTPPQRAMDPGATASDLPFLVEDWQ
jgi:putative transposase